MRNGLFGAHVRALCIAAAAMGAFWSTNAAAAVSYDKGRIQIKGVQLLQDANDESKYYYVPQFPRLSSHEDGTPELLVMKYVDPAGKASGGLFHALIEFTLPPELIEELTDELEETRPGAEIVGPVDLLPTLDENGGEEGSFRIVSAVLTAGSAEGAPASFNTTVVASSTAPVAPGSKAVVAALLDQNSATLLWDSFTGPTSDVSVAVRAYYLAQVEGYNAKITANMETIYEHYSRVQSQQKDFTKRQLRKIADDLQQAGDLKIEVVDSSAALGIKAEDLQGILDIVVDKLIELMFDTETGWSREPEREVAVEDQQIQGRQERSWLSRTFGGTENTKYYTDDQYVLKKRTDIRRNSFYLDLSKRGVIKVPVDTAGNLGGLYRDLGTNEDVFRIIALNDSAFERRDIRFQIDGAYADSFGDIFDFAAVTLEHEQPNGSRATSDIYFSYDDVKNGATMKTAPVLRLGATEPNWSAYRYRVVWGQRGAGAPLRVPKKEGDWINSADLGVSLAPPLTRRNIEIDIDPAVFEAQGAHAVSIEFASKVAGKTQIINSARMRKGDAELSKKLSLFSDPGAQVAWRYKAYGAIGQYTSPFSYFDGDFVFLGSLSQAAIAAAIAAPDDEEDE